MPDSTIHFNHGNFGLEGSNHLGLFSISQDGLENFVFAPGVNGVSGTNGSVSITGNLNVTGTISGTIGATPGAGNFTTLVSTGNSTIDGVTISGSSSVLTVGTSKTVTINNSLTLAGTDSTTMTFPGTTDTVVTLAATQSLTNKTLSGFKKTHTVAAAATYAILVTDGIIGSTYSATGTQTLTLPSPAAVGAGWEIKVVDEGGNAGTHTITVVHNASETINGTATISSNFGVRTFLTDGTSWYAQ